MDDDDEEGVIEAKQGSSVNGGEGRGEGDGRVRNTGGERERERERLRTRAREREEFVDETTRLKVERRWFSHVNVDPERSS